MKSSDWTSISWASGAASLALAGGALALAACTPPHPHTSGPLRTISTLDCPDSQGDLTRKSVATDGKTCVYDTSAGDQVTLQLISLDGVSAQAALAPIETELKTEVPAAVTAGGSAKAGSDNDKVDINLPGIHIHANGDGRADVDAGGVHVDAHGHDGDSSDRADVQVGGPGSKGVTVNANKGGAQIRVDEGGSGVRAHYILTSETPGPHGYRMAGYEARGPAGGPIVVAQVLAKSDDQDDLSHDIHALVHRNVGG